MIAALIEIVLPVFLIIGAGYLATLAKLFPQNAIEGLMKFATNFAIPCLLFLKVAQLDLSAAFDWRLLLSFYAGATICFFVAVIGARKIFKRRPGESIAIGFGALFSNSVLLGLPIMERAFGPDAMAGNYAIVSIHAPFCYLVGITAMEFARADGRGTIGTVKVVTVAMFRNALAIGLGLGFIVNFSGYSIPNTAFSALNMLASAGLPAALFGLGGVLSRYSLHKSLGEALMISGISLFLHPIIAMGLGTVLDLPDAAMRSVVVTAAMAPGVNAYLFATMYNRAIGAAASTVLLATAISIFSATFWLGVLP